MLYQPTLTPAALPAARADVRAHLRVHLPQAPADDSSLDAAIAAALRDWDTADPLIWYYRPLAHTITLHPAYTLTDAYYDPTPTTDPRPDPAHAAGSLALARAVGLAETDPAKAAQIAYAAQRMLADAMSMFRGDTQPYFTRT